MCELVSMRALRPLGRDDEMIMWTRTHTHVYVYEWTTGKRVYYTHFRPELLENKINVMCTLLH